ncbi:hypothetical protein O9Z70_06280 [Devosia sp. YIM 151766]|uniref:hypothetical protein n=1 Tax=Devosia sp. YIM 151766 TaxID=3017325 RepID=UPI00255C8897|nr:hypothetical protein [Devosia sp. YIM 151766]WIY54124.1 hypothetical protein O9Z70_06280 [Devosia sp. YIM 151766]
MSKPSLRYIHNPSQPSRFYLRRDGQYLHWSAKSLTIVRDQAWSGTERQGLNCIVKFPTAKGCVLSPVD